VHLRLLPLFANSASARLYNPHPMPRPILILGPTAGGKSDFAVELAERLSPAQILSADSMQIYRHMDAGTAKPPADLRRRVTHHLIDIVAPDQRFTVADWLQQADALIDTIQTAGGRPIVVGGTNLYIKAMLEGLFEGPPHDPDLRTALAQLDNDQLHQRLAQIDPDAAQRIHRHDKKKLIRAVEVFELTGKPISHWQQQWTPGSEYRHNPILIGLAWRPSAINLRINARVKAMFYPDQVDPQLAAETCPHGESLVAETRRLHAAGLLGLQARQALGYKQVSAYLAGECSLEDAFEQTKILTRRLAKTQRTWLKRFRGTHWLEAEGRSPADLAADAAPLAHEPRA